MTDKTHQLIGLTAATSVILIQNPTLQVTWPIAATVVIGSFFGSLAPDIDQPTANIWDTIPLGHVFGKLTQRFLGGHRHLSHSILGVILFSVLITILANHLPPGGWLKPHLLSASFIVAFIAHLLADSVTVEGIPLFWPFGNKMGFPPHPFQGARMVTGKWFENLIVFPLSAICLLAVLYANIGHFCPMAPFLCR